MRRATDRPHVLVIAMHFPPSRASGVFRPLAMANHLVRAGWDVTVITIETDFFEHITRSADRSLESTVDPRVRVERVPMPMQHLETDIRRFGRLRGSFPKAHDALWGWLQGAGFPERYNVWIPGVVRRVLAVHRRQPVDVVLATGNPWSSFAAAWAVRRARGIPYVMDYRDSWTLDQFSGGDAFPEDHAARRWERRLVRSAARVVFVNRPMRDWHARRYPESAERMLVLENGSDPELLGEPVFRRPLDDSPLRFGYVGTVTTQLPHEQTWAGWELASADPLMAGATAHLYGHLGFFSRSQGQVRALLPSSPASRVTAEGPVPKKGIAATYEALDVLLMLIPSSPFVTGGKVYEYMATGKPIVAVHTPDTAASDPLRGYPLWFPVAALDAESVRDALLKAARAAREATPEDFAACLAHARRYTREALLQPFERELRSVVRA